MVKGYIGLSSLTGKPELLFCLMFVVLSFFPFSGFMKSSIVHAAMHVCKI